MCFTSLSLEKQPACQAGIRDHLVQFSHLAEEETEARKEAVSCLKVSEEQSGLQFASPDALSRGLSPCPWGLQDEDILCSELVEPTATSTHPKSSEW